MFSRPTILTFAALLSLTTLCLSVSGKQLLYPTISSLTFEDNAIEIEVTEKVDASTSHSKNGKISIAINGGVAPYNITCHGPESSATYIENEQLTLKNLKTGNYLITVRDSKGNVTYKLLTIQSDK